MSSTNALEVYDSAQRHLLLDLTAGSILHGLDRGRPLAVNPGDYPEHLRLPRATFVTLEKNGDLRGCIGMLEAQRPLVEDVAQNAFSAAFRDPRFEPLRRGELPGLQATISVLSVPEPMAFDSEADALAQLHPGSDGLILEDRGHRGTFLPAVWEQLPDAPDFLSHLKRKAGLPPGYWSGTLKLYRYRTESFGRCLFA